MPKSDQVVRALAERGHKALAKKLSTVLADESSEELEEQLSGILQEPIWKGAMLNAKEGMKSASQRAKSDSWGDYGDREGYTERLMGLVEDDMSTVKSQAKVLENYAMQETFGDQKTLTALKALMLRLNACFYYYGAMQGLRSSPQTAAVEYKGEIKTKKDALRLAKDLKAAGHQDAARLIERNPDAFLARPELVKKTLNLLD